MRNRDGMENIGRAGLGLVGAVEVAEHGEPLLKDAMSNIIGESNFGHGVHDTELGNMGLKTLGEVQKVAPEFLVAGGIYIGLKTMWDNANLPGQERAS
jgi:hypothetical protein